MVCLEKQIPLHFAFFSLFEECVQCAMKTVNAQHFSVFLALNSNLHNNWYKLYKFLLWVILHRTGIKAGMNPSCLIHHTAHWRRTFSLFLTVHSRTEAAKEVMMMQATPSLSEPSWPASCFLLPSPEQLCQDLQAASCSASALGCSAPSG